MLTSALADEFPEEFFEFFGSTGGGGGFPVEVPFDDPGRLPSNESLSGLSESQRNFFLFHVHYLILISISYLNWI